LIPFRRIWHTILLSGFVDGFVLNDVLRPNLLTTGIETFYDIDSALSSTIPQEADAKVKGKACTSVMTGVIKAGEILFQKGGVRNALGVIVIVVIRPQGTPSPYQAQQNTICILCAST
jgi:hypothetical protein